jgi:hypothetical protein
MSRRISQRSNSNFQRFRLWCIARSIDCLTANTEEIVQYLSDTHSTHGYERMIAEYRSVRRTYRIVKGISNAAETNIVTSFISRVRIASGSLKHARELPVAVDDSKNRS